MDIKLVTNRMPWGVAAPHACISCKIDMTYCSTCHIQWQSHLAASLRHEAKWTSGFSGRKQAESLCWRKTKQNWILEFCYPIGIVAFEKKSYGLFILLFSELDLYFRDTYYCFIDYTDRFPCKGLSWSHIITVALIQESGGRGGELQPFLQQV